MEHQCVGIVKSSSTICSTDIRYVELVYPDFKYYQSKNTKETIKKNYNDKVKIQQIFFFFWKWFRNRARDLVSVRMNLVDFCISV